MHAVLPFLSSYDVDVSSQDLPEFSFEPVTIPNFKKDDKPTDKFFSIQKAGKWCVRINSQQRLLVTNGDAGRDAAGPLAFSCHRIDKSSSSDIIFSNLLGKQLTGIVTLELQMKDQVESITSLTELVSDCIEKASISPVEGHVTLQILVMSKLPSMLENMISIKCPLILKEGKHTRGQTVQVPKNLIIYVPHPDVIHRWLNSD